MTMLLEVLERHRARHLFRSSHLKPEKKSEALEETRSIRLGSPAEDQQPCSNRLLCSQA